MIGMIDLDKVHKDIIAVATTATARELGYRTENDMFLAIDQDQKQRDNFIQVFDQQVGIFHSLRIRFAGKNPNEVRSKARMDANKIICANNDKETEILKKRVLSLIDKGEPMIRISKLLDTPYHRIREWNRGRKEYVNRQAKRRRVIE
jgi:hypothetical protein